MKLSCQARPAGGFTLIELIISAALMAMILASAYLCMSAGLAGRKMVENRTEAAQNARAAMSMITADLRAACILSTNVDFIGMARMMGSRRADNLDFATRNFIPKRQRNYDFCEVSYFADEDRKTGLLKLMRRRDPTPDDDPFSGGVTEEIATGLTGMKCEYYDGFDWYDEWGDASGKAQFSLKEEPNMVGLPEAVRITLSFSTNPPKEKGEKEQTSGEAGDAPMVFQSVARLNLAPISLLNSSSSSGSSGTAGGEQ